MHRDLCQDAMCFTQAPGTQGNHTACDLIHWQLATWNQSKHVSSWKRSRPVPLLQGGTPAAAAAGAGVGGCTCGLRKTFVRIEMFLLSTSNLSRTMEWRGRVCLTMKALPRRKASRTRELAFLTSPRFGARLPALISDSQWLSGRRCALCSGAWLPMPAASLRPAR